jgi:hypothetical protein
MAKLGKTVLKETAQSSRMAETEAGTLSGTPLLREPKHVVTLSEEEVAKLPKALLLFVKTYAEL